MPSLKAHERWPASVHLTLILGPLLIAIAYAVGTCSGWRGFFSAFDKIGFGLWSIILSSAFLMYKNSERLGERELKAIPEKAPVPEIAAELMARRQEAENRLAAGQTGQLAVARTVAVLGIAFGAMRIIAFLCGVQ